VIYIVAPHMLHAQHGIRSTFSRLHTALLLAPCVVHVRTPHLSAAAASATVLSQSVARSRPPSAHPRSHVAAVGCTPLAAPLRHCILTSRHCEAAHLGAHQPRALASRRARQRRHTLPLPCRRELRLRHRRARAESQAGRGALRTSLAERVGAVAGWVAAARSAAQAVACAAELRTTPAASSALVAGVVSP
jgi:hypothetical protein